MTSIDVNIHSGLDFSSVFKQKEKIYETMVSNFGQRQHGTVIGAGERQYIPYDCATLLSKEFPSASARTKNMYGA